MSEQLDRQAIAILRANDRGGYTVPTAGLYPYQWNWDSAFCALGFAEFDRDRAWREIESLFEGQWANGMLPHIIFRKFEPTYFPGPDTWDTRQTPPSSGISQPPVAASVVARLLATGDAHDASRAGRLLPKLHAWHRWFHSDRDPRGSGLIATVHPWETGRDNSPDWDGSMANVAVDPDLEPYTRRDTSLVDTDHRPQKIDYDRFLTILKFGRDHGWDSAAFAQNGPFWVADPGLTFILLRADRDLLQVADRLGDMALQPEIKQWIERSEAGVEQLWHETAGGFCARDLRTGELSQGLSNASCLALYASAGSVAQRRRLVDEMQRLLAAARYALPSWDPRHGAFDARRYWRGPIWAVINYLVAQGLRENDEHELAERLRADTARLIEQAGFYEYFNPLTGAGLGGSDFSWTAAIWLTWASPSRARPAA